MDARTKTILIGYPLVYIFTTSETLLPIFKILLGLVFILCLCEWANFVRFKYTKKIIFVIANLFGLSLLLYFYNFSIFIGGLFWLISPIFIANLLKNKSALHANRKQSLFLPIIYLGTYIVFLFHLRDIDLQYSIHLTIFATTIAWINDYFAYFLGKKFGQTKMFPKISKNKTWEGFFYGIITAVFFTSILAPLFFLAFKSIPHAIVFGLLIGLIGTYGDLVESIFKRIYSFKDSGYTLPGHGGFLDRNDSLIPTIIFSYFFWSYFFIV